MRRFLAVTTALISSASLLGCSSSPTVPAEQSAQHAEKLVSYWREMSINFCDWDHRPDNSVCHTDPEFPVDPNERLCSFDANGRPAFDDEPPPRGGIDLGIGLGFAIDPSSSCSNTTQTYPDGSRIYGGSALCAILRDHATYEALGPVLFTKSADQLVARMDGFYDNVLTDDIHVSASFGFRDSPPPAAGDMVVIDIQTLNAASQWVTRSSYASTPGQTGVQDATVRLDPNTAFRIEIHTGNYQGSRTVWLDDLHVLVPVCIPDQANPGHCL